MAAPTLKAAATEADQNVCRYQFDDEVGAADELQRLQALRDAAQCGIADIEAGRFVQFESRQDLRRHLAAVTHEAIRKGRSGRRLK